MDSEAFCRIIAIGSVACLYVLCVWNLVRYMRSSKGDPVLLKLVLLNVGSFAVMIVGFVILNDVVGLAIACVYTVVLLAVAFVLTFLLRSRWIAQEQNQQQQLEELLATIEALRDQAGTRTSSLDEVCSKAARTYSLTRREEEVLGLLLQEFSYEEIEKRLYLSHSTIKSHVRNLYRKMEVNRRELLSRKVDEYSL